jgi:hypothetical protein
MPVRGAVRMNKWIREGGRTVRHITANPQIQPIPRGAELVPLERLIIRNGSHVSLVTSYDYYRRVGVDGVKSRAVLW